MCGMHPPYFKLCHFISLSHSFLSNQTFLLCCTAVQTKDLKGISIDLLVPGMMVNARVQSTLENGVMLSFLTYFTGTVSMLCSSIFLFMMSNLIFQFSDCTFVCKFEFTG